MTLVKLFMSLITSRFVSALINTGIRRWIIDLLVNWYSKLKVAVRGNNVLSYTFMVGSGVRQGGCLPSSLFNVIINMFVINLHRVGVGCHVKSLFIGCLFYSDDTILMAPSVSGVRKMPNCCGTTSKSLKLMFNCNKSCCIQFDHHISVRYMT